MYVIAERGDTYVEDKNKRSEIINVEQSGKASPDHCGASLTELDRGYLETRFDKRKLFESKGNNDHAQGN